MQNGAGSGVSAVLGGVFHLDRAPGLCDLQSVRDEDSHGATRASVVRPRRVLHGQEQLPAVPVDGEAVRERGPGGKAVDGTDSGAAGQPSGSDPAVDEQTGGVQQTVLLQVHWVEHQLDYGTAGSDVAKASEAAESDV